MRRIARAVKYALITFAAVFATLLAVRAAARGNRETAIGNRDVLSSEQGNRFERTGRLARQNSDRAKKT
jgi:hypothetical protein